MSKAKKTEPKFDYVANLSVGGVSSMNLFQSIDSENFVADQFISEFNYLEQVSNSVDININSSGGSVLSGLSIFSTILNSSTPTRAIITGVAASMSSVIALAADETVMNDFGTLMIHLPYSPSGEGSSEQLDHFANMLSRIYEQRLGKTKEEVMTLLEGEEGEDGTWFTPEKALELGFISSIIPTGIQVSLKKDADEFILNKVESSEVANKLQEIAANITIPEIKSNKSNNPEKGTAGVILNESVSFNKQTNEMDLEKISASLGIKDANLELISAKVNEVVAENKVLVKQNSTANTELLAKVDEITANGIELAAVSAKLDSATVAITEAEAKVGGLEASIAKYKEKEAEVLASNIEAIVDKAIEGGKISADTKSTWIGLMGANFDGANSALEALATPKSEGKVKLSNVVKDASAKTETVEKPEFLQTMSARMAELNK